MKIKTKAYAKINLHLEVLNRREDGYHNLFSLNASAGPFDVLTFSRIDLSNNKEGNCSVEILPGGGKYGEMAMAIPPEENLITKAVKLFCKKAGTGGNVTVELKKNIPSGAGLGGGSSDAAAALKTLNGRLEMLGRNELAAVAAGVGADVPYCLTGGLAICEGIGERIEHIAGRIDYTVLIADCGIHIDTGWAYKSLNRLPRVADHVQHGVEKTRLLIREHFQKGAFDRIIPLLKNDFEDIVFRKYPVIKGIKEEIIKSGARYAGMTGSGSSVIGLFKKKNEAEKAEKHLKNKARVLLTEFIF